MPGLTPVTTPVNEPTVATAGVPLLHVPPGVALDNVTELPTHKAAPDTDPVIMAGSGFTVTMVVTKQPEGNI